MAGKRNEKVWPDWKIELLKELWSTGLSTKKIADRLGGVTKNGVISKAHALNLPSKASQKKAGGHPPKQKPPSTLPYMPRTGFRPVPQTYFLRYRPVR